MMLRIAFSIALLIAGCVSALAQTPQLVRPCTGTAGDCTPVSATNPLNVTGASSGGGFPAASTPITGNAAGTTGAVVGTLSGAASKTTYICGFSVSGVGGTAAIGPVTVAGLVGSSMVFQLNSAAAAVNFTQTFSPCIPASAANTSITTTTTADGTATAVDVNSWGYRQ